MLNGFNECGLSKHQNVKIKNFPGGTTDIIIEKVETLGAEKPWKWNEWHHEWSQFPKLGKQTSPNTKIAFSSLITRKDKKDKILTRKSNK